MGEPISICASIIAILQLGSKVISYNRDVWNSEREQNEVQAEVYSLFSLLTRLRCRVEEARADEPWFQNVRLLGRKNGEIYQIEELMSEMAGYIDRKGKSDRWKQALKWKFTKEQVKLLLERIERLKSLVQSALMDDQFNLSLNTQGRVVDTLERVVAISEQANKIDIKIEKQVDEAELDRMSQWLRAQDPSENYHAALKKRHPNTGSWLIEGPKFEEWKNSENCLMWLHGSVGCGKTVLSATVLESILELEKSYSDVAVSYFFFDFNDTNKQLTQKAARSILFQLARKAPQSSQDLKNLYHRCDSGEMQPSNGQIYSLLRKIISNKESTYIVIDALDECTDREDLLTFICDLIGFKLKGLRVVAASRRERDIEEQLRPITDFEIDIQSAVVDNDIRIYVQGQLSEDAKLRKWEQSVHDDITNVIMEKAHGMFRWVYCQLQSLRKCSRKSEIYKSLRSLSKTLDETYERILRSLESEEKLEDAIMALRWLCYSKRPLRLTELAEVLAFKEDNDGEFILDRFPDADTVKDYCSSLVTYGAASIRVPAASPENYSVGGPTCPVIVRLAHFSVQEYLLSNRCVFSSEFQAQTCHGKIAESCLRYLLYLSEQGPLNRQVLQGSPLALYSAEYWWQHAQNAHEMNGATVFELSSRLLNDKNALHLCLQLFDPISGKRRIAYFYPINLYHPVYYAAAVGLPKVVESELRQAPKINAVVVNDALRAVSYKGHERIVQLLLDAGAEVNAQGWRCGRVVREYGNALLAASYKGHERIVQLLLDAGAEVNAQGWRCGEPERLYGNALQAASDEGHERIVQLLLDAGAEVNAQGGLCGSALQAASCKGHERIVQLLLDAGAEANAQGERHSNALEGAVLSGNEEVVRILLAAGADINAQGGYYGNALQAAAVRGRKEVVRILLNAGVDINTQGGRCGNALQAAVVAGNEEVVRMLLDAGADVYAPVGIYGSAFQRAHRLTNVKIKDMLLDAGAEQDKKRKQLLLRGTDY